MVVAEARAKVGIILRAYGTKADIVRADKRAMGLFDCLAWVVSDREGLFCDDVDFERGGHGASELCGHFV